MAHLIREQRIRQRLNWFRKAQELGSVTDACVFFGIPRKTSYKWWKRYATSAWDRLSLAGRPRSPHLNGKVEQSHRIDTEEFYRGQRCRTLAELAKAHRRFNQFYNTTRPHGGPDGLTPLERLRQFAPYRGLRRLYLYAGSPTARAPLRSRPGGGGADLGMCHPCVRHTCYA